MLRQLNVAGRKGPKCQTPVSPRKRKAASSPSISQPQTSGTTGNTEVHRLPVENTESQQGRHTYPNFSCFRRDPSANGAHSPGAQLPPARGYECCSRAAQQQGAGSHGESWGISEQLQAALEPQVFTSSVLFSTVTALKRKMIRCWLPQEQITGNKTRHAKHISDKSTLISALCISTGQTINRIRHLHPHK